MSTTGLNAGKKAALGFGAALVTAVCGMGIYLPFYSSAAVRGEEARRNIHTSKLAEQLKKMQEDKMAELNDGVKTDSVSSGDNAPGGMWKNIQRRTDQKKSQQQSNENH